MLSTLLVLTACARQAQKPESALWNAFKAWSHGQFGTNGPTCETTTLSDGTVYLEVYGLTASNLQESLIIALSSTSPVPSKVTFWTSEPSWAVHAGTTHAVETGQAPSLSDDQMAQERQTKLIREVKLKQ